MPVGANAVSAYIRALDEALADRFEAYRAHLEAAPLAAHTRRTYAGRVAGYLSWLAELDPLTRRRHGDPFTDGHARDYTVRDYRTHLVSAGRAKPASVNLTLAAVDQTRRLLRAAERTATGPGGVRDRAIACVLLFAGLRIAELVALDTGDLSISARKGQLTVRRGKGERYRQVPVNSEARNVLDTWLAARRRLPGADGPALFLSLKGQRLSARAVDLAVRRLGRAADVTLSAHTLRHACLAGLVRARPRHRPRRRTRRPQPTRDHPPVQPAQRHRPASRHGRPRRRLLTSRQRLLSGGSCAVADTTWVCEYGRRSS